MGDGLGFLSGWRRWFESVGGRFRRSWGLGGVGGWEEGGAEEEAAEGVEAAEGA